MAYSKKSKKKHEYYHKNRYGNYYTLHDEVTGRWTIYTLSGEPIAYADDSELQSTIDELEEAV